MTDPVLRLSDVVKTYPGVMALKGVSLEVLPGEIHALLGENGAGKSTLIAVAAGSTVPDAGTVEIGGQRLLTHTPAAAQALGLAVVYQHPSVLDDLTVTENMLYPLPAGRRPGFAAGRDWTRARMAALGADVDPRARADELTPAERQLLEISRALALDARVLDPRRAHRVADRPRRPSGCSRASPSCAPRGTADRLHLPPRARGQAHRRPHHGPARRRGPRHRARRGRHHRRHRAAHRRPLHHQRLPRQGDRRSRPPRRCSPCAASPASASRRLAGRATRRDRRPRGRGGQRPARGAAGARRPGGRRAAR